MNRYPNTRGGLPLKAWTFMVAQHLLPQRHRATIIWIFRLSCVGKPTEIFERLVR
jgi:hypothetical protein